MTKEKNITIPKTWVVVGKKVDKISENIIRLNIEEKVIPLEQYYRWLDLLTGYYMFFAPKFKLYEAIVKNFKSKIYMQEKERWKEVNEKFVSASADRLASLEVSQERLQRDYAEGYMLSCYEGINTCKKHIPVDKSEYNLTK